MDKELTKEEKIHEEIFNIVSNNYEMNELNGGECVFSMNDEDRNRLLEELVAYVMNLTTA